MEENKGDQLQRPRTILADNTVKRSNFTIEEVSGSSHSQESKDDTPRKRRKRENSILTDNKIRIFAKMHTEKSLVPKKE